MAFLRSVSFPWEHSWSGERGGFRLRLLARTPSSNFGLAGTHRLPSIRASETDSEINGNRSVSAWILPRILKIKISRDTRQFLRNFFYSEMPRPLSSSLLLSCFSVIFLFSLSFSFSTNYFSTPPGVCHNKKSPSHFTHGQQQ